MPPIIVTIQSGSFTFSREFSWRQAAAIIFVAIAQCGMC
jgi:hypothetical protein